MSHPLPKYFKDADGFCYRATDILSQQADLTPWDGDVNAAGFAADPVVAEATAEPAPQRQRKKGQLGLPTPE